MQPLTNLPQHSMLRQVEISTATIALLEVVPPNFHSEVLLAHGFTGSKEDFFEVADQLGQLGFRVIAPDHRGQNQSEHTSPTGYTLTQLATDLSEVIEQTNLTRPHLLGHSFGGLVAQEFALNYPDSISSLTLFCSGPGQIIPMANNLNSVIEILQPRTMQEAWHYFLDYATEVPIQGDADLNSMRSKRWLSSDKESVLAQAQILLTAKSKVTELARMSIPTHVVYGEHDDAWPISEQLEMATQLDATVTMIANTGHCPNEDNPKATALALASYWKEIK